MDFYGQVLGAVRGSDAALIVVDASGGVQVGTRRAWQACEADGLVSRAFVITGLDKENTSFDKTLEAIRHAFGNGCVPVVVPVNGKMVDLLAEQGLLENTLVVATSDTSPLVRMRAAYAATAVAEFFRDQGKDVLLMMDSVTRFAMAAREVGLAVGEPPTSRGYTPSVFAQLPKLLERAGRSDRGTITGVYTVLVDGDDFNEPVADAVRSILDGHLVLTRQLADQGHYPCIDVLKSISRLRIDITPTEALAAGRVLVKHLATYMRVEDMVNIGAYSPGSNLDIDQALAMIGPIRDYLQQSVEVSCTLEESFAALQALTQ
jgi:flagellum-specific ATP synthase